MRMYARGKVNPASRLLIGILGALSMFVSVVLLTHGVVTHGANPYSNSTGKVTAYVTAASNFPSSYDGYLCTATGPGGPGHNINGNQHADFTATIVNPTIDLGASSSTIHYNLQLDWKACGGDNVGAYAIYSDDFCQITSGYYGSGGGDGTAHDCLKYVGNSTPSSYVSYLGCNPGANGIGGTSQNNPRLPCTTSQFPNIQVKKNHPNGLAGQTVPESITLNNPDGNNTSNGSRVYTGSTGLVCEYYTYTESNGNSVHSAQNHPDKTRCVSLSLTITWFYTPNPTSTCTATLSNYLLAPGQQAIIHYTVATQHVSGAPSGSIVGATASGGSIAQQGLTASGANLTGSALYTAPSAPGTYTIDSGTFASSPGTYNSRCPSFGSGTVVVSYMPYFSVEGGDIAAGSGFGDSCTTSGGRFIKSWNADGSRGLNPNALNDYRGAGTTTAALATGSISDFVSGLGLSGAPSSGKFGTGSTLSFTNTTNTNNTNLHGGHFDSLPCLPDYYDTKPADTQQVPNPGPVSLTGLATGTYTASGTITIESSTIPAGRTVSLYVRGNVYVRGNITYGPYALTTVPRFNLYVQGNISIAPGVTELHGVYIAQKNGGSGGNIITCNDSSSTATESYIACKTQLTIYGAAAAEGKLALLRTYGSLNGSGSVPFSPAEVVRYTPELWLGGANADELKTQAYTSLPPVL